MTHDELWRALDTLAAERGLSPSGLAKLAGLDPTSLNRSKRFGPNGPRWPSTESLSRVLAAAGVGLDAFATLVSGARVLPSGTGAQPLPPTLFSRLGRDGYEMAGRGFGREPEALPVAAGAGSYLVRLDTDRFEPALRQEALLLVSPQTPLAIGDRAIAFTGSGTVACLVASPAPWRLDTQEPVGPDAVLHRIIWSSL